MKEQDVYAFIKALERHDYDEAKSKLLSCINDGFPDFKHKLLSQKGKKNRTVWHHLCRTRPDDEEEEILILGLASDLLSVSSKDDFLMKDSNGFTPIHSLFNHLSTRSPSMVHLILDRFHSQDILQDLLVTSKDSFGRTPLHYLARNKVLGPLCCEKILAECFDSFLKTPVTDNEFKTPLHFAAATFQSSSIDMMQLWIQYAPLAVIMYDWRGWLPIDFFLHSYGFYYARTAPSQSQQKHQPIVSKNKSLYYCRLKRQRLSTQLEHQFCRELWPKIKLFLVATYKVLIREEAKQLQFQNSASQLSNDKKEIKSMTNVHFAASCQSLPMIVLICANINDPKAVGEPTKSKGNLPLHLAASVFPSMTPPKYCSYEGLYNSRWDDGFEHANSSTFSLQKNNYSTEYISSHSMIEYLLELNIKAARVSTRRGQLALHLACMHGKSWKDIRLLLLAAPETILCQDRPSLLYPFMLAAVDENNTLDVVYELLMFNPVLVFAKR